MTVNSKVRTKVRSEETSPEVASLAGRILKATEGERADRKVRLGWWSALCTVGEIRKAMGSLLTQIKDKAKP